MTFSARLSSFRLCLRNSNPSPALSAGGAPPDVGSPAARLAEFVAGLRRFVFRPREARISNRGVPKSVGSSGDGKLDPGPDSQAPCSENHPDSPARTNLHPTLFGAPRSGLSPLANLSPQPQRQREVAIRKRDSGSYHHGIMGAVQCTSAQREAARFGPESALERRERPSAATGRCPFDREHLVQVGPASVAGRTLHIPRPARRATSHQGYSR